MNSQIANDEYSQALRLGQKEYRELLKWKRFAV